MKTFRIAVDVKRIYHVDIAADSEAHALELANQMQSTKIAEDGDLEDVEVTVLGSEGTVPRELQEKYCECGRLRADCVGGYAKNRNTLHADRT